MMCIERYAVKRQDKFKADQLRRHIGRAQYRQTAQNPRFFWINFNIGVLRTISVEQAIDTQFGFQVFYGRK